MATYYVANAGSDSNAGLSAAAPFQTLAHATGQMASGDTLLLNRGDRWYETLTVPQSNVTIDAYGATSVFDGDGYCINAPVVDGGTLIANNAWSAYSGGSTAIYVQDSFSGTSGTNLSAHTPNTGTSWTAQLGNTMLLDGTGGVYSTAASTTLYYCAPVPQNNGDFTVQANITFKTVIAGDLGGVVARSNTLGAGNQSYYAGFLDSAGNVYINRVTSGTGGTVVGPTSATTIVAGTAYTLALQVVGLVVTLLLNGTQVAQYTDTNPLDKTNLLWEPGNAGVILRPGAASETATTGVHASNFSAGPYDPGSPTNTYQASVATSPTIVDNNGAYAFQGGGMNSLTNGQWFWQGGTLYLRSDGGSPANVTSSTRNNGIVISGVNNVTVQNVAVEHASYEAYAPTNASGLTLNQIYAQRTSLTGNGHNGCVGTNGTSTNLLLQYSVFRQIAGVAFNGNTGSGPLTVQYNRWYDLYERFGEGVQWGNTADTTIKVFRGNVVVVPPQQTGQELWSLSTKGGGAFFGDNWIVERNLIVGGPTFGTTHPGNSHIVRDNFYYQCGNGPSWTLHNVNGGGGGIRVTDNSATAYSGSQFYRNALIDCAPGIFVDSTGTANRSSYLYANNVVLNLTVEPVVVSQAGVSSGNYCAWFNQKMSGTFANNVVYNSQGSGTGGLFFSNEISANAWTSDYNLWSPETTGVFKFKGTAYNTLAAYQAGQSRDVHSTSLAPSFVNQSYVPPARPDLNEVSRAMQAFRTLMGSPARNAGVVIQSPDRPYGF